MLTLAQSPLFLQKQTRGFFFWIVACLVGSAMPDAYGQNDGMVFSPEVVAGQTSLDFRTAYNPDEATWVYRNHIQYGFSDSFNLRAATQHRIDSSGKWDFRFFRAQALWQFLEDEKAGWDSALRFEFQIGEGDDAPSGVRVAWTGAYDIDENWQIRGNFLTGYRTFPDSDPGALLEVRGQISRRLNRTFRLSLDYFGNMNDTKTFGNWDSQNHQTGPTLRVRFNESVTITVGALFGISRAASSKEFRIVTGFFF